MTATAQPLTKEDAFGLFKEIANTLFTNGLHNEHVDMPASLSFLHMPDDLKESLTENQQVLIEIITSIDTETGWQWFDAHPHIARATLKELNDLCKKEAIATDEALKESYSLIVARAFPHSNPQSVVSSVTMNTNGKKLSEKTLRFLQYTIEGYKHFPERLIQMKDAFNYPCLREKHPEIDQLLLSRIMAVYPLELIKEDPSQATNIFLDAVRHPELEKESVAFFNTCIEQLKGDPVLLQAFLMTLKREKDNFLQSGINQALADLNASGKAPSKINTTDLLAKITGERDPRN